MNRFTASRRKFLSWLAGASPLALGLRVDVFGNHSSAWDELFPGRSAEALGRAYLQQRPESLEVLREAFSDLSSLDAGAAREALRARVRKDFRGGDTVWVRGWLLARSEARFCALLFRERA